MNINFSRFVREAIEQRLNGGVSKAPMYEYKLSELEEAVQEWTQRGEQITQEIHHLKEQLSILKEKQEQQKKQLPPEVRERLDSLKKEREVQDAALKEARAFIKTHRAFVASVDWSRFTDISFRLPEPIRSEARELDKNIRELHGKGFAFPSYHVALALGVVRNWIDREEKRLIYGEGASQSC